MRKMNARWKAVVSELKVLLDAEQKAVYQTRIEYRVDLRDVATGNVKHFSHAEGLRLLNWIDGGR